MSRQQNIENRRNYFQALKNKLIVGVQVMDSRRTFLKRAAGFTMAASFVPVFNYENITNVRTAAKKLGNSSPEGAAADEDFWYSVQKAYNISPHFINLENGYFSPQPKSGVDAICKNFRMINEIPSYYMRRQQGTNRQNIHQLLARFAGCDRGEIVLTRNTTESLNTIIMGLDLKMDDEVIWGTYEYPSMREALIQRAARDGIKNVKLSFPPVSKTDDELVEAYRRAITPKTKAILISHITYLSGQILPVRRVCDMAHEHGVEVIADCAHSFTHVNYKIPDLHCDYYGASLHKWMGCPLGTGLMYIKKDKIKKIWPLFGDRNYDSDNIMKLNHIGTRPCAVELTVADAIKFNESIGLDRKEARLRYLKDYWFSKVSKFPKVVLNTPADAERSCGLANVGIEGMKPAELVNWLYDEHKIFTVAIDSPEVKGARIAPNIYTNLKEIDVFIEAMRKLCYS